MVYGGEAVENCNTCVVQYGGKMLCLWRNIRGPRGFLMGSLAKKVQNHNECIIDQFHLFEFFQNVRY